MARQYLSPDGTFVNETGSRQYLLPDGTFINETAGGVAGAVLAADSFSVATSTAALTTSILLAANAVAVATVTAALTNNGLGANAVAVATATAALTTSILLATSAVAVATATAALTTIAAVRFSTPALKNNTGTVLSGETGVIVNIYNSTTGALVLRKTGLSSDGSGVVAVADVTGTLVASTVYSYEVVLSSNGRRLPTATAA